MKPIKKITFVLFFFLSFGFLSSCNTIDIPTKEEQVDSLLDGYTNKKASFLTIPIGGNAYITKLGSTGDEQITDGGLSNWTDSKTVISVYFRLQRTGVLTVKMKAAVLPSGSSTVKLTVNGIPFTVIMKGSVSTVYTVGSVTITNPGYVKVDFEGVRKTGDYFADVSDLIIEGSSAVSDVNYANDPANFYWSRRGPSVHIGYDNDVPVSNNEWNYNEVTVPAGQDKVGSYYMANGFGEGYFGMQVNSPSERRILFSVWDPDGGKTTLIKKGTNIVVNDFGNEGTGGQSYLIYKWKAGNTYKFLNQAKPDGLGNTIYSAWFFGPETNKWTFIATWKRPNTTTYLTGFYSFLENFDETQGYLGRKVQFNNQWVRTATGVWIERTKGVFTVDLTGENKQRMDYAGGVENGSFYLVNGGFFATYVNANTIFSRPALGIAPSIDFAKLPLE